MTLEEINNLKYKVCCPLCDNVKCVRGTDKCEAEIWAKQKGMITMTIEEAIKRYTDNAEYERTHGNLQGCFDFKQLADWLKELKESRMVLDILGQFLADMGLDVCCEDLVMADNYCEKYCDNQKPLCWYRWAKMKAREVNADESNL